MPKQKTPEVVARELACMKSSTFDKWFDIFVEGGLTMPSQRDQVRALISKMGADDIIEATVDFLGQNGIRDLSDEYRNDVRPELLEAIINGIQGHGRRYDSAGGFLAAVGAADPASVIFFDAEDQRGGPR
jgi:hypothetical protein